MINSKTTDHRDARDRQTPVTHFDEASWGHGGNIQFNTQASTTAQTTDVSVAVEAITDALDDHFNGGDWAAIAHDSIPCEIRPKGTEPTPVQLVNMANRTIEFDPRQSIYDRSKISKGEAIVGDVIFTEPTDTAALFSSRVTLLDAHLVAGFTSHSLGQMMDKWMKDFEKDCGSTIADILIKSPSTHKVSVKDPSKLPRERAEDLIDILTVSMNQSVGNSLSEFVLLMHQSEQGVLERAAHRAGVDDIEDLLGCRTQFYSGTNRGIFMLPKGFASLSFRQGNDGDVWQLHSTRNSSIQGWDIEITGIADVMAQAKVKLKLANPADPTEKLQVETVAFPLITCVVAKS
ncbi:hypothetical protein AA042_16110 [Pseudomonas lundensis]|uniref:hypothetical protein n=1 Tax=Pseudomonas TaxID=286 RepID=UPI000641A2DD|nr:MULTISPECIES: hypothetical protein [Pseudomonas]AOZ14002.1 hypothetical protein AA042_16110 [Pseudomonas lundensis]MBM1192682.1 hypothetical protein [Pseudomonas weihenstephanensis]QVQ78748.1 hypothetical protein KIN24_06780 [Pseudomonas lundensis]QVQ82189.1 hypothetical protein KIY13_02675 [Pseudomonas lundensis]